MPFEIMITGDNNTVEIGENVRVDNKAALSIVAHHAEFKIGKNTKLNKVEFFMTENNSRILIGEECMFSWDVGVWCTDGHSILDASSKNRVNRGRFVEIGNHVWIGKGVQIGKNVKIASGCIVGWHSVVARSIQEENCIAAGVPAQIVKRNRIWDVAIPSAFDNNYEVEKQTPDRK